MREKVILEQAERYIAYLREEERSQGTQRQYRRDIMQFLKYTKGRKITKEIVIQYKEKLIEKYQASSANTKIAAVNGFLLFIGKGNFRVKQLKIQRKIYCPMDRELTKEEYLRLLRSAREKNDEKLLLMMETLCGMGIRISELSFITADAVRNGEAFIRLKGKNRTVLMGKKLRRKLKEYMRKQNIREGALFVTKSGRPMDRSNIWKMMKNLCGKAKVNPRKVFPHNLRHLFARTFYGINKDIVRLADVLGHSSINTTRIYIISTGKEHQRYMDSMELML